MRKSLLFIAAIFITSVLFAQAPPKMSYQAVIRDNSGQLVTNQSIGMQISILQGSPTGSAVYVETQTAATNANGLVSLEIGLGVTVYGAFPSINWSNSPYFIKTETDINGGTDYTITGTNELLSVPYALYAEKSSNGMENGTYKGEMLFWNGTEWKKIKPVPMQSTLELLDSIPTWMSPTDVYSPATGKIWMDRNLGQSEVASSFSPSLQSQSPEATLNWFQWGRGKDGHQNFLSPTTLTRSSSDQPGDGYFIQTDTINNYDDWRIGSNVNLWQGVNGINNPCPAGYRVPTNAEWNAERDSWSSQDAAGAFASPLKLTFTGRRKSVHTQPLFQIINSNRGYYWSSTTSISWISSAYVVIFDETSALANNFTATKITGCAVRCIRDF